MEDQVHLRLSTVIKELGYSAANAVSPRTSLYRASFRLNLHSLATPHHSHILHCSHRHDNSGLLLRQDQKSSSIHHFPTDPRRRGVHRRYCPTKGQVSWCLIRHALLRRPRSLHHHYRHSLLDWCVSPSPLPRLLMLKLPFLPANFTIVHATTSPTPGNAPSEWPSKSPS